MNLEDVKVCVCEYMGGGKGIALLSVTSGQSQCGASCFDAGFFPLSLGCSLWMTCSG